MGRRHAWNLTHEVAAANVVAVMDPDAECAQQVADACGGSPIYTDAHQLISASDVDALLIVAPDRSMPSWRMHVLQ